MPAKSPAELITELRRERAEVRQEVAVLRAEVDNSEALQLLARVTALDERVAERKRVREESDRRVWNLIMIGLGAVLSILGGIIVQLVMLVVRK